jgi:predicted DNA-binding protein
MPNLIRAHDEAVETLMAAHTSEQLARWRAEAGRPPLTYVRPAIERYATFRIERMRDYAEHGYRAAREALARAASRT